MNHDQSYREQNAHLLPKVIYKFRSWKNPLHQKVLTQNQLYCASPAELNDPMDCRNTIDFSLLDTKEKVKEYVQRVANESSDNQPIDSNENEQLLRSAEIQLASPFGRAKHQIEFNAMFSDMMDSQYGVVSFSTEWKQKTLWERYGDHHRGYALGFDEAILRNWLRQDYTLFAKGGVVSYHEKLPKIDPLNYDIPTNVFLMTHTKTKNWSDENEYRLTKHFGVLFGEDFIPTVNDRVVKFPSETVCELVIGMICPEADKNEMITIGKEKKLPVYQVVLKDDATLDRQRLA
ncbi:MAG: DUF2971 domain-containing protein [Flavobacteriales bacterium]|nr:DUF2971 domain-containing protein [Flavobacteriales bacterium]